MLRDLGMCFHSHTFSFLFGWMFHLFLPCFISTSLISFKMWQINYTFQLAIKSNGLSIQTSHVSWNQGHKCTSQHEKNTQGPKFIFASKVKLKLICFWIGALVTRFHCTWALQNPKSVFILSSCLCCERRNLGRAHVFALR
jgi:hypothetical protein